MKKFDTPMIEIVELEVSDVVTTSEPSETQPSFIGSSCMSGT